LKITWGANNRNGPKGLQYLMNRLGGRQIRYCTFTKLNPINQTDDDIDRGFGFIHTKAPPNNIMSRQSSWMMKQLADPSSPIYGWDKGTIKDALKQVRSGGSQATRVVSWPLALDYVAVWFLEAIKVALKKRILSCFSESRASGKRQLCRQ
jgi:hypothetical protein